MARKRRSKDLKKRPTTREGRQPRVKPTPERLAHFKRDVGRDWEGYFDSASDTPLKIMKDRGLLNGNTSALVSAGEGFRSLYIHRNGQIHAKSCAIGQMSGNGSIALPRDITDLGDIEREQLFQKLNTRLFNKGRWIHEQVINVAVCENVPTWLQQIIEGRLIDIKCREREDLITGLETLIK